MPSVDQLDAFVAAAEQGSFSAAARKLRKAQSAISNAISNLEIESGVDLFDRSSRNPVLTSHGVALLKSARAVLHSHQDYLACASSLTAGAETQLCMAIEQSIATAQVLPLLIEFEKRYPHIEFELLDPGPNDVAELIRQGRADIGLMMEQEHYPQGFKFRGIGHARVIPVCSADHPLARLGPVSHGDLRGYRQLVTRSLNLDDDSHIQQILSPKVWYAESPYAVAELVGAGLGWSLLHEAVVADELARGKLVKLELAYQQVAALQGVDVVWTEKRALGTGGQWLLEQLFQLNISQG